MENLLSETELGSAKIAIRTVTETATLQQWVYPMKVLSVERNTDRNGDAQLKFVLDTGFKKQNSTDPRLFYKFFHLTGKHKDGNNRIDDLARFLKRCFKQKEISNEILKMTIGRNISVATAKDNEGYLNFWYAGHYDELESMRKIWKTKESNGNNNPAPTATVPEPDNLLKGIENPEALLYPNSDLNMSDDMPSDDLPF